MSYIDINKILQPISETQPTGIEAEKLPLFVKISHYRESDNEGQDDKLGWSYQARHADWNKVSELCLEMLESQSKDLHVACWLAQALTELHNLPGLIEGIEVIAQLFINYWDTLHPAEDIDHSYRQSLLGWLDKQNSLYLTYLAFDPNQVVNLLNWKRVQHFEQRVAQNPDARARLLKEGHITMVEWKKAATVISGDAISQTRLQLTELHTAITALDELFLNHTDGEFHIFTETLGMIKNTQDLLASLYPEKKPTIISTVRKETELTDIELPTENITSFQSAVLNNNICNNTDYPQQRAQAVRQLEDIINLFRKNEPCSPVPYLLERAVRWSGMNLVEWMADLFSKKSPQYTEALYSIVGSDFLQESGYLPSMPVAHQAENPAGYPFELQNGTYQKPEEYSGGMSLGGGDNY